MKRAIPLFAVLAGCILGSSLPAEAQKCGTGHRWNINHRQAHQGNRMYNGIDNGSLNKREAYRLDRRGDRIALMERRMRQNGLSAKERAKLNKALAMQSRSIYTQKHD